MITPAQMYWLTRLECVVTFFQTMAIIIGIVIVFLLIGGTIQYFGNIEYGNDDKDVKTAKWLLGLVAKVFAPCFIVFTLLSLLIPTTKEMAAILVVPKIANSEKVQQAGNKLYELAVEWMDELKHNKNNKQEYPNTDDALAAWKKHREEYKCDCKFESWLKQPCDEEIEKAFKDMPEGVGVAIAGLMAMKAFTDLAEAAKERETKGNPDEAEADDKRDGLKCPLCGGEHGKIGILAPIFKCPDCNAVISKADCFDRKTFREWYSGLTK